MARGNADRLGSGTPTEDGTESRVNHLAVVRNTRSPLAGQKSRLDLYLKGQVKVKAIDGGNRRNLSGF